MTQAHATAVAMEHYRLCKHRGPEVWARVRLAYEAGESGPSVARRLDVGLANLRKKARKEGWSRRDQARRLDLELAGERVAAGGGEGAGVMDPFGDGPIDRQAALEACLDQAAAAMARGEGQRALAVLRAVLAYGEVTRRRDDPGFLDPTEPGRRAAIDFLRQHAAIEAGAAELAPRMLVETYDGSGQHAHMIYHWRAEHLGPEAAARDRAAALASGRPDHRYWDEDGVLKPLERLAVGKVGDGYERVGGGIGARD